MFNTIITIYFYKQRCSGRLIITLYILTPYININVFNINAII